MKTKLAVLLLTLPVLSYAGQIDMPEITIPSASQRTPAQLASPSIPASHASERTTAKGIDLVDGAIVCRSYDLSEWIYGEINKARHARRSISPEMRKQAALINGYDPGAEPRPADYGCVLVPSGTPMAVTPGNFVPLVSGTLPNGQRFRGVTLPPMVGR